jgi:hypothetical protein
LNFQKLTKSKIFGALSDLFAARKAIFKKNLKVRRKHKESAKESKRL